MRYSVMLCNQGKYLFKNGAENFNIIRIHQKVYYFIYLLGIIIFTNYNFFDPSRSSSQQCLTVSLFSISQFSTDLLCSLNREFIERLDAPNGFFCSLVTQSLGLTNVILWNMSISLSFSLIRCA